MEKVSSPEIWEALELDEEKEPTLRVPPCGALAIFFGGGMGRGDEKGVEVEGRVVLVRGKEWRE